MNRIQSKILCLAISLCLITFQNAQAFEWSCLRVVIFQVLELESNLLGQDFYIRVNEHYGVSRDSFAKEIQSMIREGLIEYNTQGTNSHFSLTEVGLLTARQGVPSGAEHCFN